MTGSDTRLPHLRVVSPTGQVHRLTLDGTRRTVGRNAPHHEPDLALEPDPQGLVSRLHLVLDRDEDGQWWATCHGRNGTRLRPDTHYGHDPGHGHGPGHAHGPGHGPGSPDGEQLVGRTLLRHGDTLLVLADVSARGEQRHWQLTYIAEHGTVPAPAPVAPPFRPGLHYDWVTSRVYRVDADRYTPVEGLRPMCHHLLRHMASRGERLAPGEITFGYAELIAAVWDDPVDMREARRTDLAHLVYEVRQCVEDDPAKPRILETVRGVGYRLHFSSIGAN
ncbi:winged helix-turn-helix domain-containing protein [Streptomyces sp. NPDC048172]|uniref:winged helix-turn-helix domain-containing protein n=1 Tax=Streptomyces sp. NPDC048172 TaxID=3365505 RepID=UPI003714A672